MKEKVLGLPVDVLSRYETINLLTEWAGLPGYTLKHVVTAYSEFYVNGLRDKEFGRILTKADLVTPDGRSVLAAVEYERKTQELKNSRNQNIVRYLTEGIHVGWRILKNDLGETVTGVWLLEEVCRRAEKRGWKVFVLGGWGNVNDRATRILLKRFPNLRLMSDSGEEVVGRDKRENERVVEKINKFKPDFLFVQYRPIQQEKWIDANRKGLKVKVAVGIGGTLDELVGDLKRPPRWMESAGLKWLWRLIIQPKRWRRIIDAVIVFPWLVFKNGLPKK